jgi:hypothetical protein
VTQQQIERGIWYYDQKSPWQPKGIVFPNKYSGDSLLTVNCMLSGEIKSNAEQKKLIKDWCNSLPSLKNVKYIWFSAQLNQELFDSVCEMPNLEGLCIDSSSIQSIEKLPKLSSLKHLYIANAPKIKDISPLVEMTNLVTLDLENIKVLQDISPICELTGLEGLGIDGAMMTYQKIITLKPIHKLQNLKYLTLIATKILDKSLSPIADIKSLVRVSTANWYKKGVFEYLFNNLPNLKYGNVYSIMTDPKYCETVKVKY